LTPGDRLHFAALEQRPEGDLGQKRIDPTRQVRPQIVGYADEAVLTIPRTAAARRVDALADRTDDLRDADARRWLRQRIAATWAPQTVHEARPLQLAEQLFEIGLGNALTRGDVGECYRSRGAVQREIEHRRDRIAAFRREPHGIETAWVVKAAQYAIPDYFGP